MSKQVSPKQVARAIGVSESTLKRWCDRGLIPMTKTAGGHRRIEVEEVLRFLRESGRQLAEPELMGLKPSTGMSEWTLVRASERAESALIGGEESVLRQLILDVRLAGHSVTTIFDEILTPALHRIGEGWGCGDVAVYQERRGCEICMRILHEIRRDLSQPGFDAPVAIGGTLEGDIYTIPVTMAESVLRSAGWKATTLGTNLPFDTLSDAVEQTRPRLFWVSVAHVQDESQFASGMNDLFATVRRVGSLLAVGGRALTSSLRRQIQYTTFCESFRDLELFASSVFPSIESSIDLPKT